LSIFMGWGILIFSELALEVTSNITLLGVTPPLCEKGLRGVFLGGATQGFQMSQPVASFSFSSWGHLAIARGLLEWPCGPLFAHVLTLHPAVPGHVPAHPLHCPPIFPWPILPCLGPRLGPHLGPSSCCFACPPAALPICQNMIIKGEVHQNRTQKVNWGPGGTLRVMRQDKRGELRCIARASEGGKLDRHDK